MSQLNETREVRERRPGHDAGFALVAVIWISTLLAVIAFMFTTAVRSTLRSAEAELATSEAEAAAEAGVNLAILDLMAPARGGPRFVGGAAVACSTPAGDLLVIRVRDEAGKVDLNIASEELITALLAGLGLAPEEALARAAAMADFRDGDGDRRQGGAEAEEYAAAGLTAGPKNAPFAAVEELARVIGFDGELVRKLRPFVTVHSEQDGVDPASAAPELAAILRRGAVAGSAAAFSIGDAAETVPEQFVTTSVKRNFGVEAEARTARGARYVREAIVSLVDQLPRARRNGGTASAVAQGLPYRIWRWRRGEAFADAVQFDAAAGPC